MTPLLLTSDELALLRMTGDLFFVEESPLYPIESERRAPVDYEGTYRGLVDKGVVDARAFRVSDAFLNRIAPVTECEARVIHLVQEDDGKIEQHDHYLLEEIAVSFSTTAEGNHLFGPDLDEVELIERLARHFVPRRAGGDRVEVVLTPHELVALSLLVEPIRRKRKRTLKLEDAERLLRDAPLDRTPFRGAPVVGSGKAPPRVVTALAGKAESPGERALQGLLKKGVFQRDGSQLTLRAGLYDLCIGLTHGERHTFVRSDFAEGEWLLRETTFFPVDGGLFSIGPHASGIAVRELDGKGLRTALQTAVGPVGRDPDDTNRRALKEMLLKQSGAPALRR